MINSYLIKQQVHLITFADGSTEYRRAAERVARQAANFKGINHVHKFCGNDLDFEYYKIFPHFPQTYPKGYGLWSWKPFLVYKVLKMVEMGDIIIYLDAGCEINKFGFKKFEKYIDLVNEHGQLFFQVPHAHAAWTKSDLLDQLSIKMRTRNQVMATFFMLKKSRQSLELIGNWMDLCRMNNGGYLKDPDENEPQHQDFISHRHDQSCLSTCVLGGEYFVINKDETWNENLKTLYKQPFVALRNRGGASKLYKVLPFPQKIFSWLGSISYRVRLKINQLTFS